MTVSSYEIWSAGMLAFGDLGAYPTHASAFTDAFRTAWSDRGLGGPFAAAPGVLLNSFLMVLLAGKVELAQQVHFSAWIPVAFAGMVYLCRRWLGVSWTSAVAGGVVYITTPVVIGLVVAGAGGLLWAYALAPTVIATAEKVRVEGFRAVGWFAAAVALLSAFSAELLIFGFLIAAIWIVIGDARRDIIPAMAVALTIASIAALPGIVGRGEVKASDRLIDKALVDFTYTYDKASLPRLLRLAGNQGDPMDPLGYNGTALWTLAGFVPCFLFVMGLLVRTRGELLPLRLSALGGVIVAALLGLAFIADKRRDPFEDLPVLLAFRNPEKLMILLAAVLVAGSIYGADRWWRHAGGGGSLAVAALAVLGLYLILYGRPAFSGHWGVKTVRGDAFIAKPELLSAARYLERADPSLPGKWRVAWVPFTSADVLSLERVLPQWANDPVLENRDPNIEDANGILEASLQSGDIQGFHTVADRAGVRYLVVRANADRDVARAIGNDPDLTRIHRGRGFDVWQNIAARPRIRSFAGLTTVVAPERAQTVEFESRPVLRLGSNPLEAGTPWMAHPREDFTWTGKAIRVRASHSNFWPVLAQRIPVHGSTSYKISAQIRTRRAIGAHLKVIWYRNRTDREDMALDHDYALPVLTGNRRWTRVGAIIESPSKARFGELAFLAGRGEVRDQKDALSWIKDLRMAPHYRGDLPSTAADVVAEIPELVRPNHELADAAAFETFAGRVPGPMTLDVALINPRAQPPRSKALENLFRRADRVVTVAQAEVMFEPRRGVWRNADGSVELASARGAGSLPLGLVPTGNYFVSVIGCHLRARSVRIVTPVATITPRLSGSADRCGRMRTKEPVVLGGEASAHFTGVRGASIERIQAIRIPRRESASRVDSEDLRITAAASSFPRVRGLSSVGLTLADAYHSGWKPSGSNAHHFRTLLGFNGFLVEHPHVFNGLFYGPQSTRDVLLVVSGIGWLSIIALLLLADPQRRARLRAQSMPPRGPYLRTEVAERVRESLQPEERK